MFNVTADEDQNTLRIVLRGELAMDTVEALLAFSDSTVSPTVDHAVFECSGLSFIDSTGVSALLQAALRLREAGVDTRVDNLDEEIREMLDIMGFFEILES